MEACIEATRSYEAFKEAVDATAVEVGAVNKWLPQPNLKLVCEGPAQVPTMNKSHYILFMFTGRPSDSNQILARLKSRKWSGGDAVGERRAPKHVVVGGNRRWSSKRGMR